MGSVCLLIKHWRHLTVAIYVAILARTIENVPPLLCGRALSLLCGCCLVRRGKDAGTLEGRGGGEEGRQRRCKRRMVAAAWSVEQCVSVDMGSTN